MQGTADAATAAEDPRHMLETALRVASSFEDRVHARVKSRMQREVAATALELGLTETALRCADSIEDWRRLEVLAMVAQSLATTGRIEQARACLARAVSDEPAVTDWMRERLDTEIAVAYARLGDAEQARRFAGALPPELTGRVEGALTAQAGADELDRQADAFDRAIASGSLDIVRSGIDGHLSIWTRLPRDRARADRAERAIREGSTHLPKDIQIRTRIAMARAMLDGGRAEDARRELLQASEDLRATAFEPEIATPLARDLAHAEMRSNLQPEARALMLEMLARYERDASRLVDMERADALRPIAEGLHETGAAEEALRAWTLALEAGALNANARPRAEDLCLTWLSIARSGVTPTARMREIEARTEAGLKAPW
jgi:tetratricopeptide (TPR) repeat protein